MAVLVNTQIRNDLYATGSITAAEGFTGSLQGTASWTHRVVNTIAAQLVSTTGSGTQFVDEEWGIATVTGPGIQLGAGNNVYLDGQIVLSENMYVSGSGVQSVGGFTGSLIGTSSFASSASYIVANRAYTTLTSGSDNYITCSFGIAEQYFDLTTGLNYTITCSNPPPDGRLSDIRIFVNNTAVVTSSLAFGASWKNLSGGWPATISASKSFMITLTAYGQNTVVGSFIAEV